MFKFSKISQNIVCGACGCTKGIPNNCGITYRMGN